MPKIQDSTGVQVPVRQAYNQWTQFEGVPQVHGEHPVRPAARRHPCPVGRRDWWQEPSVDDRDHRAAAGQEGRLEDDFLRRTGNLKPAQMLAGHADIGTTANIHAHLDTTDLETALRALNEGKP